MAIPHRCQVRSSDSITTGLRTWHAHPERTFFDLPVLEVVGQVSIVILVRSDRDELEMIFNYAVGKEILRRVDLELVDQDTPEIALFHLSDRWVVQDLADLTVEDPLLVLSKLPDLLFE